MSSRLSVATASILALPPSWQLQGRRELHENQIDMAGDEVVERRAGAAVGNMRHLGAGDRHEQLGCQMRGRADALRGIIELARIGLGIGHEFLRRLRREIGRTNSTLGNFDMTGKRLERRRHRNELL